MINSGGAVRSPLLRYAWTSFAACNPFLAEPANLLTSAPQPSSPGCLPLWGKGFAPRCNGLSRYRGLLFGPRSSGRLLGALLHEHGPGCLCPHLWHRLGPAWLTPPVLGCDGHRAAGFASGLLTRTWPRRWGCCWALSLWGCACWARLPAPAWAVAHLWLRWLLGCGWLGATGLASPWAGAYGERVRGAGLLRAGDPQYQQEPALVSPLGLSGTAGSDGLWLSYPCR